MAKRELHNIEELRKVVDYDPLTGEMRWKPRPRTEFRSDGDFRFWNKRHAGKQVGFVIQGYLEFSYDRVRYRVHRAAYALMTGRWPKQLIDHRDRDRANNRWDNLREATRQQNQWNRGKAKHNTSGFKGVIKNGDRWLGCIRISGRSRHLGVFDTREAAHAAYCQAASIAHGEFFNSGT